MDQDVSLLMIELGAGFLLLTIYKWFVRGQTEANPILSSCPESPITVSWVFSESLLGPFRDCTAMGGLEASWRSIADRL